VTALLGLDVGTSAIKALVLDTDGHDLAHSREPTPWRRVDTGAELDPEALVVSTISAARAALIAAGAGRVAGVGVASMGETGTLLDGADRPLVPSIAWHDSRGAPEADDLAARLGEEEFAARTGLPVTSGPTLVKYRWMRANWPAATRGVRWLTLAEWIVLALGGDPTAELSLASRTGFYDLHDRRPWSDALDWAGAPLELISEPVAAGTPMGRVGSALEGARGAVLTVGGHDHLAAAVGAGAVADGDVLDSCGTAEAFVQATSPLAREAVGRAVRSGLEVGLHAVEGKHAVIGAVPSGTAFEHMLSLLGVQPSDRERLEVAALEIERRDARTLSVTGLAEAGLTLRGIGRDASPAAAYHAVLDAAGAAGADVLARMAAVAGPARRVVVAGGWAAGAAARAVKERHLGPVRYLPPTFTGARGAALAAGRAAGVGLTAAGGEPVTPAFARVRAPRPRPRRR
jgi:sugar (pentulose or hexulose) kinase